MKRATRRAIAVLGVLLVVSLAILEGTSIRNRNRLSSLKEEFCSIELPEGSERRQCVGVVGTVALGAEPGEHCDYLVWMKVHSDTGPNEMNDWLTQRGIPSTDGVSMLAPEVFESRSGIEPAGHRYRYHVQVIDAGHAPGLDLQCWFGV